MGIFMPTFLVLSKIFTLIWALVAEDDLNLQNSQIIIIIIII